MQGNFRVHNNIQMCGDCDQLQAKWHVLIRWWHCTSQEAIIVRLISLVALIVISFCGIQPNPLQSLCDTMLSILGVVAVMMFFIFGLCGNH